MSLPFVTLDDGEGALFSSNPWDVVKILGAPLPGICRVKASESMSTDVQKPNGQDAAAIILRGYVPAQIEIEVTIWTKEQWRVFQALAPTLLRKPTLSKFTVNETGKGAATRAKRTENKAIGAGAAATNASSVSVYHPSLAALGINAFVITGMSAPVPGPQPQSVIVQIKGVEYIQVSPTTNATRRVTGTGRKIDTPISKKYSTDAATNSPETGKPSKTDAGP